MKFLEKITFKAIELLNKLLKLRKIVCIFVDLMKTSEICLKISAVCSMNKLLLVFIRLFSEIAILAVHDFSSQVYSIHCKSELPILTTICLQPGCKCSRWSSAT